MFRGVQRDGTEIAVKADIAGIGVGRIHGRRCVQVLEGPEEAGFEDLALSLCGCTVPQRFKKGPQLGPCNLFTTKNVVLC